MARRGNPAGFFVASQAFIRLCPGETSMRDLAINLRALPEQWDLIDHAASLLGKNRSDFVLEAACEKAQEVVLDQVHFPLDDDRFWQFTALLDVPPGANPGLERLMAVTMPQQELPHQTRD